MAARQNPLLRRIDSFEADLERAEDLFEKLVINGYTLSEVDDAVRLRQPDRRDAAQFIFFEIAAKFEAFVQDLFMAEVRQEFCVLPARAEFIMGTPDRGLDGVMGWGSLSQVKIRARNLLGATGFLARIDSEIGATPYQHLAVAHKLRNRIAHDSGKARSQYRKALGALRVPRRSRKGASVGRALIEYPHSVLRTIAWFRRFLAAYRRVASRARAYLL